MKYPQRSTRGRSKVFGNTYSKWVKRQNYARTEMLVCTTFNSHKVSWISNLVVLSVDIRLCSKSTCDTRPSVILKCLSFALVLRSRKHTNWLQSGDPSMESSICGAGVGRYTLLRRRIQMARLDLRTSLAAAISCVACHRLHGDATSGHLNERSLVL